MFVSRHLRSINKIAASRFIRLKQFERFSFPNQIYETQVQFRRLMAEKSTFSNRLANAKSPYLLQHAHNPVDWYPWCNEAIERARKEDKVIFLSVGYSTCHWCHVMERESFMNEDTARLMNQHFINIKVDREERPDIDKLYMTFILLINGSGGWPMSVFLTPDLTPITGGTYFPPRDRWGMPGFPTILAKISDKWKHNRVELKTTGESIIRAIQKSVQEKKHHEEGAAGAEDLQGRVDYLCSQASHIYERNYDQVWGGSGGAPKFPEISKLTFILNAFIRQKGDETLDVALRQLDKMANGGIHDQIFGGFARYSVDKRWHVPHFEKMLYDQGQILSAYVNAYKITRRPRYLSIADRIYKYICSDLRDPRGGFYSGEDADSLPTPDAAEKVEGAFYAWTASEIRDVFDANKDKLKEFEPLDVYEVFAHHYDVRETGNVEPGSDPHGHLLAKNILFVNESIEETSVKFGVDTTKIEKLLDIAHELLHQVRSKRCRPHLDTKIITAWNGLVLSGLSKLSTIKDAPNRQKYLETAQQLVKFIRSHLYDTNTGKLFRSAYAVGDEAGSTTSANGQSTSHGFLDDYAFLIRGLLDFYVATLDIDALKFAKELQDRQDALFWDNENGGYFYTEANAPNVIVRLKEDHDGAEPCGNSVAALNLTLLEQYFEEDSYRHKLEKLYKFFADVSPFGYVLPEMMSALMTGDDGPPLFIVVGEDAATVRTMVDIARDYYIPGLLVVHVDPTKPENVTRKVALEQKTIEGKVTAYVCQRQVCKLPMTAPEQLRKEFSEYLAER